MDSLADETNHPNGVRRARELLHLAPGTAPDVNKVADVIADLFHLLHDDAKDEELDPESHIDSVIEHAFVSYRAEI